MQQATLRGAFALAAALVATLGNASEAHAFPSKLEAWKQRYGAISPSGDNAGCQLCHGNANGGSPWNGYGWDILMASSNASCDIDGSGTVSDAEAFFCVELEDSDGDGGGHDNVTEIGLGKQPGWAIGSSNVLYTRVGTIPGVTGPTDIGGLDPLGTEPPPPPPPPPPIETDPGKPKSVQVVRPGKSIQQAIDRAKPGGWIFILPGTYREISDPVNGLNITKSGLHIVGLSTKKKRVVLENAGNQRNGIVAVPDDRTRCMDCHTDMAPPFPLIQGADPHMMQSTGPTIYGLWISGITIKNFVNNGLFTEHVDRFTIADVESVGNKNYGIFPTLSSNGLITHSKASGADDSGIWIETSENVRATHNVVEGNVNGFEISNSANITLAHNTIRGNSVGLASLFLPDIFDNRSDATGYVVRDNVFEANNKPNTARPGSILSMVPSGTGILHVGADESRFERNRVEGHDFTGIAVADYCVVVSGTPFDCSVDPDMSPGFIADSEATGNQVIDNIVVGNGQNPDPNHPFSVFASDMALLTAGDHGNCYSGNLYDTVFSLLGILPECSGP
ncbi:MAG: right-handed parallel beta-helix repeat-containing protein [Myxococcales bacterium]